MHADDASLERGASRDAVQWYFGDLIDDVIRSYPVTRTQVVDGLARMAAETRTILDDPGTVVRRRGPDELVLVVPPFRWRAIVTAADLASTVAAACGAVHERMAAALDVTPSSATPIVLYTAVQPVDNGCLNQN